MSIITKRTIYHGILLSVLFAILLAICSVLAFASGSEQNLSESGYSCSDAQFMSSTDARIKVNRLYNKWTGEHFYTGDNHEKEVLCFLGWSDQGAGWFSPFKTNSPVYRLYNPIAGDHHFTMKLDEYNQLGEIGWIKEGICCYSVEGGDNDRVPLYRLYNPYSSACNHNFTTNDKERSELLKIGWQNEGVAWYGYKSLTSAINFKKYVNVDTTDKTYTGSQIRPKVSVDGLKEGSDFVVIYGENKNVGTGTVTIKGKGSHTAQKIYYFEIKKAKVKVSGIKAKDKSYDSTQKANLDFSEVKIDGKVASDDLTVTATGQFIDSSIGSDKEVAISGIKLEGESSKNYELATSGQQTSATANILEEVKITFDTQKHGSENFEKVANSETFKVTEPAEEEYGTQNGLRLEGWYTDDSCTNDEAHKWNFDTDTTKESITLYANWVANDDESYWISPSMNQITTTQSSVRNSAYFGETWNVKKTSKEIEEDIKTMKTELKNGSSNEDGSVTNEYRAFMKNDSYHLYAKWNGSQATYGEAENVEHAENAFVEFRIIEVGSHVSDGSTLTFQATHVLPEAQEMNSTDKNLGGWNNTLLLEKLKPGGDVYSKFDIYFLSKIITVDKVSTKGNKSTDAGEIAQSKLWLPSNRELTGNSSQGYVLEGSQYEFWKSRGVSTSSYNALTMKTRSGSSPRNSSGSVSNWWLRTPQISSANSYLRVEMNGNPSGSLIASGKLGVVPCFCM